MFYALTNLCPLENDQNNLSRREKRLPRLDPPFFTSGEAAHIQAKRAAECPKYRTALPQRCGSPRNGDQLSPCVKLHCGERASCCSMKGELDYSLPQGYCSPMLTETTQKGASRTCPKQQVSCPRRPRKTNESSGRNFKLIPNR